MEKTLSVLGHNTIFPLKTRRASLGLRSKLTPVQIAFSIMHKGEDFLASRITPSVVLESIYMPDEV